MSYTQMPRDLYYEDDTGHELRAGDSVVTDEGEGYLHLTSVDGRVCVQYANSSEYPSPCDEEHFTGQRVDTDAGERWWVFGEIRHISTAHIRRGGQS